MFIMILMEDFMLCGMRLKGEKKEKNRLLKMVSTV